MSTTIGSPERTTYIPPQETRSNRQERNTSQVDPVEEGVDKVSSKIKEKTQQRGNFDKLTKAELRGEYSSEIKDKIKRKKNDAEEVRTHLENYDRLISEAVVTGQNLIRVVSEFAEAAKQGLVIPPGHKPTQAVYNSLVDKIQGRINPMSAGYLLPLIDGILNTENYVQFSKSGEQPTQFENDMHNMLSGKGDTEYLITNIMAEPISQGLIPDIDANKFREMVSKKNEEKKVIVNNRKEALVEAQKEAQDEEKKRSRESFAEQEFERLFGDERDQEQVEAMNLYKAIKASSTEDFVNYYQEYINKIMQEPRENGKEWTKELAEKEVTTRIHKTLLYVVNNLYATTLAKAPEAEFDRVASEQGSGYVNPNSVFNEAVAGKLSRLVNNAKKYQGEANLNFYTYQRKNTQFYSETTRRVEEATVPTAKLEKVDTVKFFESLREITEIERGALKYQFNFSVLIQHPPAEKSLFETIAGYARQNLKTETIDNLYILPYNEVIQAAVMSLEPMYERMFSKYDWKKSTALETELFEQLQPAEKKTLDQLLEYFQDEVPAWAITRAFYHARLMSFGKEFKYQLLSSYADPLLTDEGDPTFLGEGSFAGNSVYDIMEGAKRWGPGTDPYVVGLPTMPQNISIDDEDFHPEELQKEGEKRWKDSFTNGQMAYFDNKYFRESNPIISITNMTKMGGVDASSGWRVKYAYQHWLNEMIDVKSHGADLSSDDSQLLVKGWKSVENIGVNVLKNYAESFVIGGGYKENEAKYKDFFKFLYRRYFKEGIGQAMYENIKSDEQYWNMIKSEIFGKKEEVTEAMQNDVINKHIYNAMSVVLFERMPTEFIFMERRRSSQNGVTLQQELLEDLVGTNTKRGKWQEGSETQDHIIKNKWDVALDDIIFVQQAARVESIHKMKQLEANAANANELGILYGDLDKDRSEVNYAINESYIEQKLKEKFNKEMKNTATTPERKKQIADQITRAKELYKLMTEKVKAKPKEGDL
ncbi:MAG TPA: hypothetical protein PLS49_04540, partial [Candidatus Woesebacteria bacterium]|nr:hypothetical protein [Candidatus Woesebacteria bacterium]